MLRKDRGSREQARELLSWEISRSLLKLSVLWLESAKCLSQGMRFLPSRPPVFHCETSVPRTGPSLSQSQLSVQALSIYKIMYFLLISEREKEGEREMET